MFSLGWNWDPIKNFSGSMATQVHDLQRCNASLYMRPDTLAKLPTAELATYITKCFGGGRAMAYVMTSLYSVCLLHALRYFGREQFLLLRYEDLMRMDSASVLGLLARFTGLHPPARPSGSKMCQPNGKVSSGARNSYSGTSPRGAEMLNEAAPHLEHLFAPYATLLRELVHPDFGWRRSDHHKRPLNATMRLKREAEVEGYREHLRRRQANRMMGERRVRANIVAAGKAQGAVSGGSSKSKSKGKGKGKGKLAGRGRGRGRGASSPSAGQLSALAAGRRKGRGIAKGTRRSRSAPASTQP